MGIATPPFPSLLSKTTSSTHQSFNIYPPKLSNPSNYDSTSMSQQDYHHQQAAGIFSFSNGFERSTSVPHQDQQHHIAQQIRRDKLRVQTGFEAPPRPLVGIEEEESSYLPVYETAGMLSEMFNFPPGGPTTAAELLDNPVQPNYRQQPRHQQVTASEWYGSSKNHNHHHPHHPQQQHQISGMNVESAAAMKLFLMNPQPKSPSPTPPPPPPPSTSSNTLHMLLPNPSTTSLQGFSGGDFGQFTWVPDTSHEGGSVNNPSDISGVVEGQGLSLSLSSSLQHLDAAKVEELRMGDGGLWYYNQGGGGGGSSSGGGGGAGGGQYNYKSLGGHQHHQQALHLQGGGGGVGQNHHQVHVGFGSSSSSSSSAMVNVLRISKYVKAAQELLEEFCSVGRGQFKKNKFGRHTTNPSNSNNLGGGGSSSSAKDPLPLSAADRIEHQRRKVKLFSMLDEARNLSSLFLFPCLFLSPHSIHLFSFVY